MDRKRMALAVGMALMAQGGMAQDIPALWREVAEAGEKDQPKTAIAALEKIYDAAVAKESWDDALAAVGQRAILDGRIEEGWNAYGAVLKMDEARQTAPEKMKPLLDALSAEWLSRYFAENIWQFRQRSEIADADEGNDIDSWSLPRILKEVDARFAKTLDRPDVFAQYPASEFKCSFEQGNMSTARADTRPPVGGVEGERPREPQEDAYRPTVYDILVWRAVQFYSQTMVKNTTDDFTVTLEMPLLGDAESFMTWAAALPPDASPNKKALRLIASVMRFHKERGNALAFADADFNRLKTVQHVLQMSDVDSDLLTSAYDKALDAFVETYADNEVSARGIAAQAMRLYNQKKYVEALALAEKGMDRFPKSVGANECYNVILRVKEPSLDFETETVWARSKPEARPNGTIRVTCRNIPKIHFRLYPTTITTNREAHYLDRRRVESIVKEQHAYAWEMLTQEDGYQEVSRPFDVEEELVAGAYILVASTREDFLYEWDKNNLFAAVVQVSDLAAEITSVSKTYRVRVVNSETGVPIENASVTANVNTRNEIQATTDAEGYCEIASTSSGIMFDIRKGDERIISPSVYWQSASPRNQQENDTRALLVTDRAIYRPGQTVRYKGIYYVANATTGVYEIRPNAEYTIRFRDPNGKEIDSRKERANSFGSFSGSFVIPADRGTGHMRLEMADRHNSSVGFRVEEYKRPKFEVVFDPLKGEIKLNDNVPMSGRAATYSGLPLDQASVRWTVTRGTSYPYWFYRASFSFPQVIASGETQTDADGTFKLNFAAEPEPGAKPGDSPVFRYAIHAEVVDATGETRSGSQAIRLGFSSVSVSLEVPKWFTPNAPRDVTVRLATLNGEPVASAGNAVVHTLRQPERPSRNAQEAQWKGYDESLSPMGWETKEAIQNVPFTTDGTGVAKLPLRLPAGCYRIEATAQDKQGNPVTDKAILMVVDPASKTYPVKIPFILLPQQYECKVGETFRALWGSGYPQAYGTLEIWADGKVLKRVLPRPDETQTLIEFEVPENLRGGFTVRSSMVREGRLWQDSTHISVPWDNKELKLNWTHINSKLEPGKQEKWTLTVQDPHAKAAHAEVAAVMYDSSLDAFNHHRWYSFGGFRFESYYGRSSFTVGDSRLSSCISISYPPSGYRPVQYPDWSTSLLPSQVRYSRDVRTLRGFGGVMRSMAAVPTPAAAKMGVAAAELVDMDGEVMAFAFDGEPDEVNDRFAAFEELELPQAEPPPVMRKNLEETAFFIPDLETDGQGTITLSFIAPEALTGWRVMAFAHDAELRYGHIETSAVTQRKLMIIPNLPRFLREGDSIGIPVKVVNTSDAPQRGEVTLSLVDAGGRASPRAATAAAHEDVHPPKPFDLPPGASCVVSWTLNVPDGQAGLLQYSILAKSEAHGDGEEGFLPVLSRRVLVTESMPFSVRGGQEKNVQFKRLTDSAQDKTLRHLGVQAEMTPNATWNAILALPYLMEYPHECAEQIFHRYYANALARQIVTDNPTIEEVFRRWKAAGGGARGGGLSTLDSPLTKNQHLKALAIEETPWLRAADSETEQRHNIAVLFDAGRLAHEQDTALRKLKGMRNNAGLWPWFSGGPDNGYISMIIMTGFGRLRHVGVKTLDNDLLTESIVSVDNWRMKEDADYKARNGHPPPLSPTDALYLYGRSFFIKDAPPGAPLKAYHDERMALAKTHWADLSRLSRAQLAIALKRLGDPDTARDIIRSIRENAVVSDEQGMCWRDNTRSWWWYALPLESQAMMIEAFLEVADDQASADACALWLLQQKQAQRWPTTLSTAQAIYAILLGKNTSLAPYAEATLSLGGTEIKPDAAEAGTGYFSKQYAPADVRPELGDIAIKNPGTALAIGAVHWQYLQDVDKLTPSADDTPLRIKRQLFKLEKPGGKRTLHPLDDQVKQGDTIVTRIEVRVDRDMDFVHLKDTRAASLEPDDVFSTYRWQDGVGYFQSTRDTATHFFFDRLPRGTYVFEYECHVFQTGTCSGGFAEIQCMYAPEFNAHSASETVKSK